MSAKLIAGLLAACVVAVGGVVLYHGDCPFSGGTCSKSIGSCPTGECSLESTGACCDAEESAAPCCSATKAIAAKATCCSEATGTCEPITAAFGGAVAAMK